ncbi:armadillo repeat-containing protein 3 isoform X2 [Aplysia californica]|uniref:Armadillo repeat-containing protein 3 isoform X2 n=1 Tax=Aplysia californica TaxID=6500 RepID=A0ABM1A1G7_APLCA|nr:armadillo repeat-containing protein 3 isoform X2 [Aplysia californica]
MGKKVKKDEKPPPDDVFDTLLVESRQAATVVLMLTSPEEDVQSKACEAIYKFVEKCDENKKLLLDLEAVDPLLNLIAGEDRTVRRHAIMALGVLCAHPDVRKALRKRPEAISSIVALLSPEEDSVIHEFAALALSLMATEFTSKVAIHEASGVEPLIRLLGSSDPDVQKNSIEAIAQLVMDYQARGMVREFEGLQPILDLMKSEYAIVQRLALLTLDRLTQDAENRRVLRELEAITKLLDVLAQPTLSDLHVMVVMVLSNLLEDTESLELVKDSGGLKRLVALITDQPPPEEDTKKGDKKGGSRAGKKSAKDSKGKKEDEAKEDAPVGGDSIIPTLPDVKMCAAKAIARSARNSENRKLLHEQEAEKMLIQLLTFDSADVQASAALALAVISEYVSARDAVKEWDGLPPLVKLLNSDNGDVKEAATLALANLTTANSVNCIEISNLGGIEALIACLGEVREEVVANAACALTNLAQDEGLRSDAQVKGVVPSLIDPLRSNNTNVQSKVALAVSAFTCDADSRQEFRESGGLEPLVLLLHSGNDEVRRNAAWAITVCGVDEPTATEICKLGGLQILQEIQMSASRHSPFIEAALQRLLDCNLSAKFALYNYLGPSNIIEDGFFDCGQLRQGTPFKTLEDYCRQEMDDKRPVILLNAKAGGETEGGDSGKAEEADVKADTSKTKETTSKANKSTKESKGKSGRMSRTGSRESPEANAKKGKSKAQREKEEKAREEELAAQREKEAELQSAEKAPFTPPPDPQLVKYIEEVSEKILPLPTSKAQVVALAEFVSEKLGGSIERGQVANFSWELPLSQVRFELKSNVIPMGRMKAGIHIHRALLFKALADRIALNCSLTRGEYNRAWNEVLLPDDDEDEPTAPKFPPKKYIVDLVHEPGALLTPDTQAAVSYMKL